MLHTVISALLNKNALATDTIITARYHSKDLFGRTFYKTGDFKLKRVMKQNNNPIFELGSIDSSREIIHADIESIKAIDGMDVIRYADIYDILPDGSNKKVGRKRGRKSKHELTA
jgi:hypothetical protein